MGPEPNEQVDAENGELMASRERLYADYATTHACHADVPATGVFVQRVLVPHLPKAVSGGKRVKVLELACGAGGTVRELEEAGYDVVGVDTSPEQVRLAHQAGVSAVVLANAGDLLRDVEYSPDVVLAIDFLEHLTKSELIDLLTLIRGKLAVGGRLVARLPNASSPFFGRMQHGDLSHETALAPRSIRQALTLAGFQDIDVLPVNPVVHGIPSFLRATVWSAAAALLRLMLTAETGFVRGHVVTQNMLVVARV